MSARARRIRQRRAAVRRVNHRAVSQFGPRDWAGDAYTIPSSCYGATWMRDTRLASGALMHRAGFVITRHPEARA